MPGKFGDVIWSLPTVRAISQTYGIPVDFVLSKETPSILPLLRQQPYIGKAWQVEPWYDHQTELGPQIRPTTVPSTTGYNRVFHLSYRGWPAEPLPLTIYRTALDQIPLADSEAPVLHTLDLETPWITLPPQPHKDPHGLVIGFSDEWFELKYGLVELLNQQIRHISLVYPVDSRWDNEGGWGGACDWIYAADKIQHAKQFLGCCSALHVLACALGKNVTLMEPNSARHNPIFYSYGKTGRVHLVCGNDGLPTHDARHVREAIQSG